MCLGGMAADLKSVDVRPVDTLVLCVPQRTLPNDIFGLNQALDVHSASFRPARAPTHERNSLASRPLPSNDAIKQRSDRWPAPPTCSKSPRTKTASHRTSSPSLVEVRSEPP